MVQERRRGSFWVVLGSFGRRGSLAARKKKIPTLSKSILEVGYCPRILGEAGRRMAAPDG